MKLKVNDLYNLSLGLNDLADKELPISTSLKLEQNQKIVSEELIPTDKIRQKIIEKYKEKETENGIKIKDEHWDAYNKEIEELMQQNIELNLKEINLNELGSISIKPRSLTLLEAILKRNNAE